VITADNDFNPNDDVRYADLPPELVPLTECLADVVARMLPYWYDGIVPDLRAGLDVLVVAHGNSLRALVKHLDKISDDEITELNIPTGVPLLYELGDDLAPAEQLPILERYLADADAVAAKAAAVAQQAAGG
jgi:2,3-bisphosphoglycerate-dependent phosphoglycerate mutase